MEKRKLRQIVQQQLIEIPDNLRILKQKTILANLLNSSMWHTAKVISVTIPRFPELDITPLIEKAWLQNKLVAVPKCHPKSRLLTFHQLNSFQQLETVYSGISEPITAVCQEIPKEKIDLMIVPGIAFNEAGYRLGYGGGYYDRVLGNFRGVTVSLAFACQLIHDIPIEAHDIPVKRVITESSKMNDMK